MYLTLVPGDKDGGLERCAEHLVQVEGDGVGQVRAGQQVLVLAGHDGATAPARVNVQPQVVLPVERIKFILNSTFIFLAEQSVEFN